MHYNKLFFDFSPTSYMGNYTTTPLFHILTSVRRIHGKRISDAELTIITNLTNLSPIRLVINVNSTNLPNTKEKIFFLDFFKRLSPDLAFPSAAELNLLKELATEISLKISS